MHSYLLFQLASYIESVTRQWRKWHHQSQVPAIVSFMVYIVYVPTLKNYPLGTHSLVY